MLERVMGIEPTLFAWEARVLPLNDTREGDDSISRTATLKQHESLRPKTHSVLGFAA